MGVQKGKCNKLNILLVVLIAVILLISVVLLVGFVKPSENKYNVSTISAGVGEYAYGNMIKSKSSDHEYLSDMDTIYQYIGPKPRDNAATMSINDFTLKKDMGIRHEMLSLYIKDNNIEDGEKPPKDAVSSYFIKGLAVKATHILIYDISGRKFDKFHAYAGVALDSLWGDGVIFRVFTTNKDWHNKNAWTKDWSSKGKIKGKDTDSYPMHGYDYAQEVDIDIAGKKYIALVADENQEGSSDFAYWADAMFINSASYKPLEHKNIPSGEFDRVENYDKVIKKYKPDDVIKDKNKQNQVMKRAFVNTIGYEMLDAYYNHSLECRETIQWLAKDQNALKTYVTGGEPSLGKNGNMHEHAGRALGVLSELRTTYKSDLVVNGQNSEKDVEVYLKMMVSLALDFGAPIVSRLNGGLYTDPVERYQIFKDLRAQDKFQRDSEGNVIFDSLSVEEMRWVLQDRSNNCDIPWLNHYIQKVYNSEYDKIYKSEYDKEYTKLYNKLYNSEYNKLINENKMPADKAKAQAEKIAKQKAATQIIDNSKNKARARIYDPYYYIGGRGGYGLDYDYGKEEYYLKENYKKYDDKYDLAEYGIRPYEDHLVKLFILFEEGAVCGGVSNIGATLNIVYGVPGIVVGQPSHAAYLRYEVLDNGDAIWYLGNAVDGWSKTDVGGRSLNGWGSSKTKWDNGWNAPYIFAAQTALNHYDEYEKSLFYVRLADSFDGNPNEQIKIYKKALEALRISLPIQGDNKLYSINFDAWYGIIKAYGELNKNEAEYVKLANAIAENLKYFPYPTTDLLELFAHTATELRTNAPTLPESLNNKIKHITTPQGIAEIDEIKRKTLQELVDMPKIKEGDG